MPRLRAVAFDLFETCLSLEPLRPKLVKLGLAATDLELWFAHALRDGFACEIAGHFRPFSEVLTGSLEVLIQTRGGTPDPDSIAAVVKTFAELPAHPDVRPAFELVRNIGLPVAIVTNGDRASTEAALHRAGLASLVDVTISVTEVGHFKPAPQVYLAAADALKLRPAELALVAAHGWDLLGASRAGLRTGFVVRNDPEVSPALVEPDAAGGTLAEVLIRLGVEPSGIAPAPRHRAAMRMFRTAAVGLAAVGVARALRAR